MRAGIGFCLAFMLAPMSAHAATFFTGNDLLKWCGAERALAIGFVAGVYDTIDISQENKFVKATVCLRSGATVRQMTDVVCQYLNSNPTFRDFPAATLVSVALAGSFPCAN